MVGFSVWGPHPVGLRVYSWLWLLRDEYAEPGTEPVLAVFRSGVWLVFPDGL